MSATIKYKGNTIASITTDSSKTLKTSGNYCEGDIVVENVQDGADKILDAINSKTLLGANNKEQAELDILGLPSRPMSAIPNYVITEAKRLASVIKSHQTANSISFLCVSDLHDANNTASETIGKDLGAAAWLVRQLVPIDFGVFLGDYVRAAVNTDSGTVLKAQFQNAMRYVSQFSDASTQGNHDSGMAGMTDDFQFTATDMFNRIGRFAINVVRPATEADRGYYHFDVPNKSFRVIMLNTNDLKGINFKKHSVSGTYNDGHRVSVPQLQWFASTLAAIPNGYKFIVCSHEPIHWFDYTYTDADNVTWDMAQNWRTILNAYVGGESYSVTQDGQTVSGTFAGTNNGICCGTYHGHTHNFIDGKYGTNNIIRISAPNASNDRTNEYGIVASYGQEFAEKYGELDGDGNRVTAYFKTAAGTANETAFVVNTIDLDNMICYSDYYGAGHNRVINLAETIVYSVASTIGAHITASTIPATVEDGKSLSVTLTPDANYTNIVSVTMGGVDITAIAYANNAINIESVTGDVVITASAYFSGNYVPVVGYTDNARWSAGDGTIRTGASGNVAVNEISFDRASGAEIHFALSGIDWTHNSNCILVGLKGGAFKCAMYLNNLSSSTMANYGMIVTGSGNNCVLTIKDPAQSAYAGINSFKISGYGTGANAVITQEIDIN